MNRTITVKGVGTDRTAPDYVVLTLTLQDRGAACQEAMDVAAANIAALQAAAVRAGLAKEDLKTTSFAVETDYENRRDRQGNYERVFVGYVCRQTATLSFDWDSDRLTRVLTAVAECGVDPEVAVQFTVKDPERIKSTLLQRAAANAREKAETLCRASGVHLGELVSIDYAWGEINVCVDSCYEGDTCIPLMAMHCAVPEITPEDIRTRDTATFVWEIRAEGERRSER